MLKRKEPPSALQGVIPQDKFVKAQEYSRAKMQFSFVSQAFSLLQNVLIIAYDVMPLVWDLSGQWQMYLPLRFHGEVGCRFTILI